MDLDALRNRINDLKNKTQKQGHIWKAKDKHVIRCLPYPHQADPDSAILELLFHFNLGSQPGLLCPTQFGEECIVCEFAEKLKSWNGEDGRKKPDAIRIADFKLFCQIQAKSRYFIPVIERALDKDGKVTATFAGPPKFWSMSEFVVGELAGNKICGKEDFNEGRKDGGKLKILVSTAQGHDLTVELKKANNEDGKGNPKPFPVTDIDPKIRPTALAASKKEIDEILAKVPRIEDAYPRTKAADARKTWDAFMAEGGESKAEATKSAEPGKEHFPANNAEKPLTGTRSIEDAFGDLTNS